MKSFEMGPGEEGPEKELKIVLLKNLSNDMSIMKKGQILWILIRI